MSIEMLTIIGSILAAIVFIFSIIKLSSKAIEEEDDGEYYNYHYLDHKDCNICNLKSDSDKAKNDETT